MAFEVSFLLNGAKKTVICDSKTITVFYQRKLPDVNIISVKKVESGTISDLSQYLKAEKGIWC